MSKQPHEIFADRRFRRVRVAALMNVPDLKTVIVDAALAGQITAAEAEDLIQEYGLRHE